MARIAVVFPPLRVSRDFIDYPYFADLGAVQGAAVLREAGHDVALVDAFALADSTLDPLDEGYVRLGVDPDAVPLPDAELTLVAYTPFHRPPHRDDTLARVLARVKGRVGLADFYQSGQHYVDAPHAEILAAYPEASGYLRYEAEDHLGGFVDRLLGGERGVFVHGGELKAVSALPAPAWDLVDAEAAFRFHERLVERLGRGGWAFPITGRSMPMVSSRGCPFRCVHCSSNPGRDRSAPKTQRRLDEAALERTVTALVRAGARRVHVLDELANVSERHFDVLLALFQKHDLSFEIPNGLRADYVRDHHLARMKGRLSTLSVSAESGSTRVVAEVVDKQLDLADIERVATGAQREGVPLLVHFMIGLPGETKPEMNETLSYAAHLADDLEVHAAVQHATPLPGTRLAELAGGEGRRVLPMVSDWGPLFQGAPSIEGEHASWDELRALRGAFDRRGAWPRTLVVAPTFKCGLACEGCTTGRGPQVDEDPARLVRAMREGRERGTERLELGGGEPTLHPKLAAIVGEARRMGYRAVVLATNGCDPDGLARLVAVGLTHVAVSIHGATAATHDAFVGQAGAYDRARATLRAARAAGLDVVVRTLLHPGVLGEVVALAREVQAEGARHELIVPRGRPAPLPGAVLDAVAEAMDVFDGVSVVGVTPCEIAEGLRARVVDAEGVGKRRSVFFRGAEPAPGRAKREVCRGCVDAVACAGFFG